MTVTADIRQKLRLMGIQKSAKDLETAGLALTVCQFIVIVLSLLSVTLLLVPLFFLQDARFLAVFFALSIVCLSLGVWFWVKRAEICEHPEEVTEE